MVLFDFSTSHFSPQPDIRKQRAKIASKSGSIKARLYKAASLKAPQKTNGLSPDTKLGLQIALKGFEFENSPQRQAMYTKLANKETARQVFSLPKPTDSAEVKALRSHFKRYPMSPIGLAKNRTVLFNAFAGVDLQLQEIIDKAIQKPHLTKAEGDSVVALVVMQEGMRSLGKYMKAHPETIDQFNAAEKQLTKNFKALLQKGNGDKLTFGSSRERLNTQLGDVANKLSADTGFTIVLVSSSLNVGLVATLPAHGIGHAVVPIAKTMKSFIGDHNEVSYYGRALTNDIFDNIFGQENQRAWQRSRLYNKEAARKVKPWQILQIANRSAQGADSLLQAVQGSRNISQALRHNFEEMARQSQGFQNYLRVLRYYPIRDQMDAMLRNNQALAVLENCMDMEHPNFHLVEPVISVLAQHLHIDECIPIVGMVMSGIKGPSVANIGWQASKSLKKQLGNEKRLSSERFLRRKVRESEQAFIPPLAAMRHQSRNALGFLQGYVTDLQDYYNPVHWFRSLRDRFWSGGAGTSSRS